VNKDGKLNFNETKQMLDNDDDLTEELYKECELNEKDGFFKRKFIKNFLYATPTRDFFRSSLLKKVIKK